MDLFNFRWLINQFQKWVSIQLKYNGEFTVPGAAQEGHQEGNFKKNEMRQTGTRWAVWGCGDLYTAVMSMEVKSINLLGWCLFWFSWSRRRIVRGWPWTLNSRQLWSMMIDMAGSVGKGRLSYHCTTAGAYQTQNIFSLSLALVHTNHPANARLNSPVACILATASREGIVQDQMHSWQ